MYITYMYMHVIHASITYIYHMCTYNMCVYNIGASQVVLVVKNPPASAGDRSGFDPWVGKIPWRRAWQPTPVSLPGESMDRGAWRTVVQGVAKRRTRLSDWARAAVCDSFKGCAPSPSLLIVNASQSSLTLCNSMNYGPHGSSVHGILQARILEWVAISFSRGSSRPWDQTYVS